MATYAIGDIQGCFDEFITLLDRINFSKTDTLYIAGDLVNRGPKSLETLRFIKDLGSNTQCVLGNHDLHLLAIHYGATGCKGSDTLDDILSAPDREPLLDWLRQQKLFIVNKTHKVCLSHAGLPPCWSIKEAAAYAKEVEHVISSDRAERFFNHMYGNQPDQWQDDLNKWDRLRLITNYLTRMRFCTPEGKLDFSAKGTLASQPEGFAPWFEFPRKDSQDDKTTVLFGHWAALEGRTGKANAIGLDTGCVWGQSLTAFRLDDGKRFSVSATTNQTDNTVLA